MNYRVAPNVVTIPHRLAELLAQDGALAGDVYRAVTDFTPWFSLSGMPFFPYYTDHGPGHVTGVLTGCEALISDQSWNILTPPDAAVLVLSTLLHDSALHIREEGFVTLVSGTWGIETGIFPDQPWPLLWNEFVGEARRWDAKTLIRIFGTSEPVTLPDMNRIGEWTQNERLFIGEFLRRYHPRIAHEIALAGVPGPSGQAPLVLSARFEDIADLAGVVARSHGLEVRSCLQYLETKFGNTREFRGVHAVYLMGLLRVADYVQIQSSRAPRQLLSVTAPRSPISKGEWEAHGSVRDITALTEDPEALLLIANPPTVRAFLRLREWLEGIQSEIDKTWAVLGEVYGRFPPLNDLGVAIRRIRSNLEDREAFARAVPYLPVRAAFSTAEADLLKLLVAPLYGDRPEIGIREMLQNAVDAVREREVLGGSSGDSEADVYVNLFRDEEGIAWLEVTDRGIGMTDVVVTEYFLRAGASFRFSDAWRRTFEDASGRSQVLRSGRFGVGAVAAFLLGDVIEVTTRNVQKPGSEGISFRAHLDDDVVELRKVECPSGTTVRVRLYKDVVRRFERQSHDSIGIDEWDWYYLSTPRIQRSLFGEALKSSHSLPAAGVELPALWHRLEHTHFTEIQWTYADVPALVCNGIPIVSRSLNQLRYLSSGTSIPVILYSSSSHHYRLYYPALSVFDPNGRLPLNLQRTGLTEESYPFSAALRMAVIRDLIADFAVSAPQGASDTSALVAEYTHWGYVGMSLRDGLGTQQHLTWNPVFETATGLGFLIPHSLVMRN